jgi:hypothetical protein
LNPHHSIEFYDSLHEMLYLFWDYVEETEYMDCTRRERAQVVNFFTKTYLVFPEDEV